MQIEEVIHIPERLFSGAGVSPEFVAHFTLFVGILLLGTILAGRFFKLLANIPPIAGQILGGILLGPSLFNMQHLSLFQHRLELTDAATGSLYTVASADLFVFFTLLISAGFTVTYLLWLAGHETDLKDIWHVGVTATAAGILGAIVPVVVIAAWLYFGWVTDISVEEAVGIGLIFAATSVSIPVAVLFAQKKMHLRSSKATLGAAIIDDIFAVVLLSLFVIALQTGTFGSAVSAGTGAHAGGMLNALGFMLLAFVAFMIIGNYLVVPAIRWIKQHEQGYLITSLATVVMLFYFSFAELIGGLAGITGAYFAGMFHRMADKKHNAARAITPYVNSIFLPLFLGSIGLQLDLTILGSSEWVTVLVMTLLAVFTKFIGTFMATGLSNGLGHRSRYRWGFWDSFLFASAMVARGEVGLVVATLLRSVGVLSSAHYVITVVVIVLTTIIAPLLLNIGFSLQQDGKAEEDYVVELGGFKAVGTMYMFHIIVGLVEAKKGVNTTISLSEGRKIANLEGLNVKILYIPSKGIVLEGNRQAITTILHMVHDEVLAEVHMLTSQEH